MDYQSMTHAELVEHCEAYSASLHKVIAQLQVARVELYLERRKKEAA